MTPETTPETEVIAVPCRICGKAVGVEIPGESSPYRKIIENLLSLAVHSGCRELEMLRVKAEAATDRELEKRKQWERICPPEFRKALDSTRHGCDVARLEALLEQWEYGEMGLFITGPTRLCKTRFMFQLLAREFGAGRTVSAWLHSDLRNTLTALAASEQKVLEELLRSLVGVDILFIDDLGKGRATPAAEEAFFTIIDRRGSACKPTMFTSNVSRTEALASISEAYRAPLAARLEEKTTLIEWR